MEQSDNFEIIKKFGPSVLKVKIPHEMVVKLNEYIDKIINDTELSKHLDHGENLVGDVTQEFKLEKKIMQDTGWGNFLAQNVSKWIMQEMGKKLQNLILLKVGLLDSFKTSITLFICTVVIYQVLVS